jgi:N-acetylglutamate synthase-like GNAT family acetyltransferase
VERDFRHEAKRTALPVRLVAFVGGAPAGTIVLRDRALESHREHTPGLGGWYVAEACRGRGVGSALLRAGMVAARELNYKEVYACTGTAGRILERLGWQRVQTVLHAGEPLAIYRCAFGDSAGS